jgi:hypothetical protein
MNKRYLIELLLLLITLSFALMPFVSSVRTLNEFSYQSEMGEHIGGGMNATIKPPEATFSLSGDAAALTFGLKTKDGYWQVKLSAPKGETLHTGRYNTIEPTSYKLDKLPALAVSSNGAECNAFFGSFTIEQLITDNAGKVTALAASFTQRCEVADAPPLSGSLKYNIPLTNR